MWSKLLFGYTHHCWKIDTCCFSTGSAQVNNCSVIAPVTKKISLLLFYYLFRGTCSVEYTVALITNQTTNSIVLPMITVSSATMQWLLWRLAVLPLVLIVSNRSSTYSYSYSYNYNISNSNSYSTNSTSYFENNSPYVRERARLTYEKVAPCLLRAWMYNDTYTNGQKVQLQYPTDAEEHYQVLLEKTKSFRTSSVHQYANYAGPWIENIFIDEFIDRPLSFFNGLIPIFIQWVDNQVLRRWNYDDIHKLLGQLLRPDVIYFTVSQSDLGLGKIGKSHPNLLVLSAGGYGHVVIPLVKGYYDSLPMRKQFKTIIGFYGSVTGRSTRAEMLSVVQKEVPKYGLGYFQAFGTLTTSLLVLLLACLL